MSTDITLWVCEQPREASHYDFICSKCRASVHKLADDRIIRLLMSTGIQAQPWRPPVEALEAHTGPAIGYDDLLVFHQEMKDWDGSWS